MCMSKKDYDRKEIIKYLSNLKACELDTLEWAKNNGYGETVKPICNSRIKLINDIQLFILKGE